MDGKDGTDGMAIDAQDGTGTDNGSTSTTRQGGENTGSAKSGTPETVSEEKQSVRDDWTLHEGMKIPIHRSVVNDEKDRCEHCSQFVSHVAASMMKDDATLRAVLDRRSSEATEMRRQVEALEKERAGHRSQVQELQKSLETVSMRHERSRKERQRLVLELEAERTKADTAQAKVEDLQRHVASLRQKNMSNEAEEGRYRKRSAPRADSGTPEIHMKGVVPTAPSTSHNASGSNDSDSSHAGRMAVAQTVAPKTISVLPGWLPPPKIVRREPTRPPVIKSIAFPISQVGQLILEQPPSVAGFNVMNRGIPLDIPTWDLLFAYHVAHYVWPVAVMLLSHWDHATEVSVNLRTAVQQHAVDHYWIPPWFRNVLGDMSLGNGDKSWNLAREYRDLRRPGFPNMFQFAYWMQYRELSLLGCLPLDPYGTLSARRVYGRCIWDTITCKPSDESKTAYSDSEVKTACLEVQKALLNALVVANGYIGEIRSRGLTINPVLNLIPWPIHEASGVCDSQATERLASMGFTAELAVEMWHFLQGWLADMIKASTTPWGWTREELQEFLDGSIGDGEIPPTSAIPSDSLILRLCDLPYSNKMDQHSQTRRIINKPIIPLMPLNISIRYNEDAPGVPKSKSRAESIAVDDMRHGARLNRAALRAGAQQAAQNTVSPPADASNISCDSSTSIHHQEPMAAPSSSSSSSETSHSSSSTPSNEQSTFTALFPTIASHIDQNYDLDFSPETFWPQQSAYGRSLHASIHAPSPPITFGTTNNSVHAAVVAPIVEDGEVEMGSVDIGDEQL
ncbi:hypothetical protein C8J57DRAFT_1520981 [Mycena rebaudengoi]|nr:hypothetical protein C8J57DRAFT_1520981 [Mycena rebaudengoi]